MDPFTLIYPHLWFPSSIIQKRKQAGSITKEWIQRWQSGSEHKWKREHLGSQNSDDIQWEKMSNLASYLLVNWHSHNFFFFFFFCKVDELIFGFRDKWSLIQRSTCWKFPFSTPCSSMLGTDVWWAEFNPGSHRDWNFILVAKSSA